MSGAVKKLDSLDPTWAVNLARAISALRARGASKDEVHEACVELLGGACVYKDGNGVYCGRPSVEVVPPGKAAFPKGYCQDHVDSC